MNRKAVAIISIVGERRGPTGNRRKRRKAAAVQPLPRKAAQLFFPRSEPRGRIGRGGEGPRTFP